MRVKVSLYISGKVVEEVVTAISYEESKKVALSRNPNGRVIKAVSHTHLTLPTTSSV